MEILPCSRVGHVYHGQPYKINATALDRNKARVAKVWMDDYSKFYFERRPNNERVRVFIFLFTGGEFMTYQFL